MAKMLQRIWRRDSSFCLFVQINAQNVYLNPYVTATSRLAKQTCPIYFIKRPKKIVLIASACRASYLVALSRTLLRIELKSFFKHKCMNLLYVVELFLLFYTLNHSIDLIYMYMQLYHEIIQYEIYSLKELQ